MNNLNDMKGRVRKYSSPAIILAVGMMISAAIVAHAATTDLGPWQSYIKSGKTFFVNFDTANFDDTGWRGASDPMGTLMGGKIYTVSYKSGDTSWTTGGWNEGTNGIYSTTYKTQRPDDSKINLWGRVYTFTNDGVVTDPQFGAVGHLQKSENEKNKFPIAELGNCKDQASCKSYCDDSSHIAACVDYAEKNGMMSKEEAARAREFADVLKGEGPGACKDQKTCESYCNGVAHLNECLTFAEKHSLIPKEDLDQAKKVAAALASGATMPGGCTDKKTCETYCKDGTHVEECFAFAEKAGFIDPKEAEMARKVLPFLKSGETPGKCTTKASCDSYCAAAEHTVECVNFAEKAGFVTKEEAEMVRKTGGQGPGGCRSRETCEAYCNDAAHQEECFEFATKHDLIPPEKLKEMKDGMGQLRAGLPQLPEEARACLTEKLGSDAMTKIADGTFMPTQKMGELIKGCMADMLPRMKSQIEEAMKMATPEVKACLDKGLGAGGLDKLLSGTQEMDPTKGDVIRNCFESMRESGMKQAREGLKKMPPEMRACIEEKLGKDIVTKLENGENVSMTPAMGQAFQSCAGNATAMMDKMLEQAPPEMRACIKSKIGDVSKVRGPEDVQQYVAECMKDFKPAGIPSGVPAGSIPPAGYRPEGVPEGIAPPPGVPTGMPPAGYVPEGIPTGAPTGAPTGMPANICENFKMAPSCDYVPENVREMCKQCKAGG